MRRGVIVLATGVLLVGPTVLAFFSGGYFNAARYAAGVVAWALVLVLALVSRRPWPETTAGRVAVGGLVLLLAWTAVSLTWAPLAGPALESVTLVLLYLGALVAAAGLLRERRTIRAVEPVLALGTVVVIGYGLAGRLLPGLVELSDSARAGDRLEQPISYWNAQGALAAMGLVLCARLAGDRSRPTALRALAAAAAAPLGAGVYLSYSRGAMAAAALGLLVVVATAPTWPQVRAAGSAFTAAVLTAGAVAAFPGVASLEGTVAQQIRDGAFVLVLLLAIMLVAGLGAVMLIDRERRGGIRSGRLGVARHVATAAVVAGAVTVAGLVAGGLAERGDPSSLTTREGASRLTSVTSRRYDYWRIAVGAIPDNAIRGAGPGAFRVIWRRERPVPEGALHVHSLQLETALELGVPGLIALTLSVAGVGLAARGALRRRPALAAGPTAACSVWLLHATGDWDWQVPAVTLPAVLLAGTLIALGVLEPADEEDRTGSARRPLVADGERPAAAREVTRPSVGVTPAS